MATGLTPKAIRSFLYVIGGLLVASAVFHLAVLLVTGGSWQGSVSWRKPILFGEAFGLTCVSVAWIMTFLPKRALPGWLLAGTLGLANSGEVIWVSMQQWRGVPSHFNFETAFDAAAFNVGGGGLIFFTGVVIVAVTLWTFVSLDAPPSIAVAIPAGLILLVAAQVFGVLIIQNGIAKVLDPQTGEFLSEGARVGIALRPSRPDEDPSQPRSPCHPGFARAGASPAVHGLGREPAHPRCPRRNRRARGVARRWHSADIHQPRPP